MRKLLPVLLLSAIGICFASLTSKRDGEVLISNVTLISAERSSPAEGMDVLLRGDRIAAVGRDLKAQDGQVIDGTGMYLAPGLIDSHTHLSDIPGMSFFQAQENPETAQAARQQIPRSYLYHGVTTVIDLNNSAGFINEWNARDIRPTAYFCGGAPVIDGYPMRFIPKPVRYRVVPNFLLDGQKPPEGIEPSRHTPEAVVERIKADGAICVKTHYESGFGGNGDWPVPSKELIKQLVVAAKEQDMPVLLHANSQESVAFGTATGVDAFAHGMWTWNDNSINNLQDEHRQLLDKAMSKGIALQPTIQVLYGERDLHNPDYLDQPALAKVIPPLLLAWYAGEQGQSFRRRVSQLPYVAPMLELGHWHKIDEQAIQRVESALAYWQSKQGRLLFGSDTPSDMTYANPPGLNSRLEINRWQEAGISPATIFKAATLDNAEFFGLDQTLGTVEESKRADLLLMSKNPLESVDAYDSINTVIIGGQVVQRKALSAVPATSHRESNP